MKLLIALGTFVFAVVFATLLTSLATSAFPPVDGKPQNQVLIPVFVVTLLLGWVFAGALARRWEQGRGIRKLPNR